MEQTYEEWRLVTKLLDRTDLLGEVVEALWEATPEEIDVHSRGDDEVMTYTHSEHEMDVAAAELEAILAREAVPAESTLTRWNPAAERWQDPALPVGPPKHRIEPEWTELGELGWEVRVKTQSRADARRLEAQLRDEQRPVYADGAKRLTAGARNEEEANRLMDEIRLILPFPQIETRPLTRFRRWRIRQALLGNYAYTPPDG